METVYVMDMPPHHGPGLVIRSWRIIAILPQTGNVDWGLIRDGRDVNPGQQITSNPVIVIVLSIAPRSGLTHTKSTLE